MANGFRSHGKGVVGQKKKMDLKDQDIDFSLGSQAELIYAKLSRQKCSVDPLSQWI